VNISRTAACDDTFLDSCLRSCKSIFHTELCFLHLCFSSSTYADNCNAASEFRKSLLKFLSVEIGLCLFDLALDLGNSVSDLFLVAETVNDDGVLFLNLNGFCTAKLLHCSILEVKTKLIGDHSTAC